MELPPSMLRADGAQVEHNKRAGAQDPHRLPVDPGFTVEAEVAQRFVKGEDVAFCFRADPTLLGRAMAATQPDDPAEWKLNYDVFVICDGHSGVAANEYVRRNFLPTLQPHMPRALPQSFKGPAGSDYAVAVRAAVARTFDTLNTEFCARGELAGCTMTAVLITGGLVTVANVGDSDALLDAFSEHIPMSVPHRVNDNEEEQRRLSDLGAQIAPLSAQIDGPAPPGAGGLGPLRVWPGGLCVSRSVGDIDVGDSIICLPHVRQVLVPEWGCRIFVASDGIWDCLSKRGVLAAGRGKACGPAVNAVVNRCLRVKQGQLVDDSTCCVVDCRPYHVASFKGYQPEKQGPEALSVNGGHTSPGLLREGSACSSGVASAPMDRQLMHGASAPGELNGTTYVPNTVDEDQPLATTRGKFASNGAATLPGVGGSGSGRKRSKGGLFPCCSASSIVLEDDDEAPQKSGEEGSNAPGAATRDGSTSGGEDTTINKSSSIAKGLSKLGLARNKNSMLPPLSLYADVDTWVDAPANLTTVSESETDTTQGKSSEEPSRIVRAESGLDMGIEPPTQHTGQRSGVRWHTSAPTDSDHTTRPHHRMATAQMQPI